NRLCMAMALPFGLFHVILKPVVALMEIFSASLLRWSGGRRFTGHLFGNRDEFRFVMQESAQNLSSEERRMINRVLDLQNLAVRQIAVPLSRTVMVSESTPISELLEIFRQRGFTRLPVTREGSKRAQVVVLVFVNGFFVAAEFALVKLRRTQLDTLVAKGQRRASMALRLITHLDATLSATQLGITSASLALGWIGEPVFFTILGPLMKA